MKNAISVLIFSLCIIKSDAQIISLDSVLIAVENNHPLLESYQYKIQAADAMAEGARSWMPPRIEAGVDMIPYNFGMTEHSQLAAGVVAVEQDFPNFKLLDAKENYLRSMSAIDLAMSGMEKNDLFSMAKEAYYMRFVSEKTIALIIEQMEILKSIIQISEAHLAYGQSDLQSIYKAKANLASLEAALIDEQSSINQANVVLNYLMSRELNSAFEIDTSLELNKSLLSDFYTAENLSSSRSSIQVFDKSISTLKLNQDVARAQTRPVFGIRLEHYTMFDQTNNFSLMGMMTIPIGRWSKAEFRAEDKSIGLNVQALELQKQNAVNEALQNVSLNQIRFQAEVNAMEKYQNEVLPAYRKYFEVNYLAYQQNTGMLIETIFAFNDWQMAQMEYLDHLMLAFQYQAALEQELQIR